MAFRLECDLTLLLHKTFKPKSVHKLKNKVIWITGASNGIGKCLAIELAKIGSKLVISGRDVDRLNMVKKKCLDSGLSEDSILVNPFDIRNVDYHHLAFEKVLNKFSKLDILVNNAGVTQRATFEKCNIRVDKELFDINVFGGVNLARILVNYWYENNHEAQIAVTSSVAGKVGLPNSTSYTASKYALHGYYESLRNECYFKNIAVTIICPGPIETQNLKVAFTGKPNELLRGSTKNKRMPLERFVHLMTYAIANKLHESWISSRVFLKYMYLSVYAPTISKYIFPYIFLSERFTALRDG